MESSKDVKDCHEYLQKRWPLVVDLYKRITTRDLFITSTYRSPEHQKALYEQGRSTPGEIVTQIDGITKKSMHNYYPALAFDVCVDLDPGVAKVIASWKPEHYEPLGYVCEQLGLVWGGSWKWRDLPHIQVPREIEFSVTRPGIK